MLATKVWGAMGEDANRRGTSRRWIIREVEDSLRRLGTDWIDLYQIHRYEPDTDIEETLGALTDGAAPDRFMTHLAMVEVDDEGSSATWGAHVTDQECAAAPIGEALGVCRCGESCRFPRRSRSKKDRGRR